MNHDELHHLDEMGVPPIVRNAANRAYAVLRERAFCPHPSLSFDASLTLLMSWRAYGHHFEVEVSPDGELCWWAYDLSSRATRAHGEGHTLHDGFIELMVWAHLPPLVREALYGHQKIRPLGGGYG